MSTHTRPNKNYILQVMRDSDMDDVWGTAMAWSFACAENLAYVGAEVPSELGYRMSIAGPVIESYEDFVVAEFIGTAEYNDAKHESVLMVSEQISEVWDADMEARVCEVQQAGKILARYLGWLQAAGKDY